MLSTATDLAAAPTAVEQFQIQRCLGIVESLGTGQVREQVLPFTEPHFQLLDASQELVDGRLLIIPGRKPMTSRSVQLRLTVTADKYVAQYRPNAKGEFKTASTGKLPAPRNDQVSIQCYNGPASAEHWIRFDDFRILERSD